MRRPSLTQARTESPSNSSDKAPANLMGELDGIADLHVMREVELRVLIGLLIVEAADLPSLPAHDSDYILDLRGDHGKVRGHSGQPVTQRVNLIVSSSITG